MNPNSSVTMLECIEKNSRGIPILTFLDESSDEHIFGWCFERDEVHAVLAADISSLQPVDLNINFHKLLWRLIQKS